MQSAGSLLLSALRGLVVFAGLSCFAVAAQDASPSASAAPSATAAPEGQVCGLGKDFHAGRRAALVEALLQKAKDVGKDAAKSGDKDGRDGKDSKDNKDSKDTTDGKDTNKDTVKSGDKGAKDAKDSNADAAKDKQDAPANANKSGVVLVRGLGDTRAYTRFAQDKTFWYLTGVESPNAALLIDLASKREILFLPKASRGKEQWEGELWDASDAWVPALTGLREIQPIGDLVKTLGELAPPGSVVWISREPYIELSGCSDRASPADSAQARDPLDGRASREKTLESKLVETFKVDVRDCAPILAELRRVKQPEEIDALRRAGRAGALAMIEAMRSTRPGIGEWQIDALMSYVQRREGAAGPAYQAIVGSGPNALALHYSACSRVLRPAEMLLVDYAPEFDHYCSDITRAWPTDGVFTPRMAEIYDAVLEAQLAGIAAVKPGATMGEVNRACTSVLKKYKLDQLMPHGACHYIGLEVHDVGEGKKPLVPGVAFTVEPGVYDPKSGIGVRIEDVVVVTESGCEVVSGLVPKDRDTLSKLVQSVGLLDRDDPELAKLIPALAEPQKH